MVLGTDNQPVIAFLDSSNNGLMMLRKYNSLTNNWATIASGIPYNNSNNISMAVDNQNNVYVMSSTISGAYRTQRVYRYNGVGLDNLGIVDTATTNYATLDVDKISNTVYVIYSNAVLPYPQASVRKLNGTTWQTVGPLNFSYAPRGIYYPTIKIDKNGTPHAMFQFDDNHERLSVFSFNGTQWVNNGSDRFTKSHSYAPTIQFDSQNNPWVSFYDASYLRSGSVMKKNAGNWEFEGDRGFMKGFISISTLQLDTSDVPYVTFVDYTQQNRISVMRRKPNTISVSACGSYQLPWGNTVNVSGIYTHTYNTLGGYDSIVSIDLTILENSIDTTVANVCNSNLPYAWNGNSYSTAGNYSATFTNAAGCDSVVVLKLVVDNNKPLPPSSITQTLVNNVCGERVYRYAATATLNADGYAWTLPTSVGGLGEVILDSGDASSSRIIRVQYSSNAAAGTTDSIKVNAFSGCGNSANKAVKLSNTALNVPAAPTAITITAIQTNVCGARIYRYAAPALPAATATTTAAIGYEWSFTGPLGTDATIDSGDVNSRIIVVSYTSNAAALAGDSVKVRYLSNCGNSNYKAAKLSNTALNVPAAPTAITITAIQTKVCGARIYRYAAPVLPAATTTAGASTGYEWSFTGLLGSDAVIDSGDVNSRIIVVSYTSNLAAATGDSVKVLYTSDCGNSAAKAAKLTNTAINKPAAPTAITITALQANVCGNKKYRYAAPALPVATATAGAATGYEWSFSGNLGAEATIDSGDVNSRIIVVSYTSNVAAAAGDSVKVLYTSDCGNSATKGAKLTNTIISVPAAPTAITITALQTNVCNARKYRYVAPNLPAGTTTAAAATGYVWDFVGTLASTLTVDSGSLTSRVLTVTFTSNAAALAGDSVRVLFTSDCGNSPRKTAKLSNTLLAAPAAPTSITIALKEDVCNARKYRYIAPATLPGASTTAGAATGYLWSLPTGTVGSTGTLDSGTLNDRIIVIVYTSNAAAGAGDSIRLRYTSGCGNGAIKAQKLSNLLKSGCPPPTITKAPVTNVPTAGSMNVKVYPNPTTSQFNVQVNTTGSEEAVVRILDVQGRFVKSVKVAANQVISLGSELKAGAYMLEVRQGSEVKTTRVIKF
jgi:peroxiredoxin family protein